MFRVLVACLDRWNTLAEIPFILKKGGCTIDVLCSKDAWLKSNNYYDNWIESKPGPEEYKYHLINIANNTSYDWIILGDDPLIKLLNECIFDNDQLFKKILPLDKIENRNILGSKSGLGEICNKYSILSPQCIVYDDNFSIDDISNKLTFPVILKKDFGWGGLGITICKDQELLENELANLSNKEKIIIQEYIIGKELAIEALFTHGALITYNVSEILAYDKDQFSYSTKRNYFTYKHIENDLIKLGKSVGINGFVNLAYIYSKERNLHYLIEVDIRPNSWMAYGRFTGNNFAEGVKKIISLSKNKNQDIIFSSGTNKPVQVALFHKDIRRCLYKRDYKGLSKWLVYYRYWKFIPFYDPVLMARIIKELWKEFPAYKINKLFQKVRRVFTPKENFNQSS